ncbi:MAG: electron transport complex subunit RsxE [Erysipelotrichaceae bacterium]|jgi:electron transport complex protein RnfE|nr:electron transport complex subunit RsxE [Erysipelotrichaceae bacterium]
MKKLSIFTDGLIKENPVLVQYLGMCSALAITISLNNALGMGVTVILVLLISNIVISLLRKVIPDEIRIPVFIVVIATLVKCAELLLAAYTPSLSTALGVFIPLIVVNCIILGRAEAFASKNSVGASILDALGMGLGYTAALTVMSVLRQFLSTGTINLLNPFTNDLIFEFGVSEGFAAKYAITIFKEPVGAFLMLALIAAFVTWLKSRGKEKK